MAQISTPAVIVIVLVACLAITALGAALFKHYRPSNEEGRYNTSYEQGQYMRQVRMRNHGHLKQASLTSSDIESRCMLSYGRLHSTMSLTDHLL